MTLQHLTKDKSTHDGPAKHKKMEARRAEKKRNKRKATTGGDRRGTTRETKIKEAEFRAEKYEMKKRTAKFVGR